MPYSFNRTKRDVMKFCRARGIKPTTENVERIQREVTRTRGENDALVRVHKEMERERGIPALRDEKGAVIPRIDRIVRRDLGLGQRE